jgi:hypothetical protein
MAIAWMIKKNTNYFVLSRRRATSSPRMVSITSIEASGKDPRRLDDGLMYQIRLRRNQEKLGLSSFRGPEPGGQGKRGNTGHDA